MKGVVFELYLKQEYFATLTKKATTERPEKTDGGELEHIIDKKDKNVTIILSVLESMSPT